MNRTWSLAHLVVGACSALALVGACSADAGTDVPAGGPGAGANGGTGGGIGGSGGIIGQNDSGDDGGGGVANPTTCADAASSRSYVGCDYWPTVTFNTVWNLFDFAVVVANTLPDPADVTVTGPNNVNIKRQVAANTLETIYLPWVAELKGKDADSCGNIGAGLTAPTNSVKKAKGAYHLTSTRPVTVYQFSAIEYKGAGGPPGKDWSKCVGTVVGCSTNGNQPSGCYSFTNDASLLIPSAAMTINYRVAGPEGFGRASIPAFVAITGTQDGTHVEFRAKGAVVSGGGISNVSAGQSANFTLDAGDVMELIGGPQDTDDLSGSLVLSDKPVQVISGHPGRFYPEGNGYADHLEESVFPAETLGKEYVVTVPAAPKGGKAVGQMVKIVGNVDGTNLKFDPAIRAPGINNGQATIGAGQVLKLGQVADDFKVTGNHEFIVETFMLAASIVDPTSQAPQQKGDPSQSLPSSVEQHRDFYIFLAPKDYDVNFANVIAPSGARVTIDNQAVAAGDFSPIGGSGYSVARVQLKPTGNHQLNADKPVGLQVYGYGSYTSYQYPGGLNLKSIAPPPPR